MSQRECVVKMKLPQNFTYVTMQQEKEDGKFEQVRRINIVGATKVQWKNGLSAYNLRAMEGYDIVISSDICNFGWDPRTVTLTEYNEYKPRKERSKNPSKEENPSRQAYLNMR